MKIYHIALSGDGRTGVIVKEDGHNRPEPVVDIHTFKDNNKGQNLAALMSYVAGSGRGINNGEDMCIVVCEYQFRYMNLPVGPRPVPWGENNGAVLRWMGMPVFPLVDPNMATEYLDKKAWDETADQPKLRVVEKES